MSFKSHKNKRRQLAEINVVPYIDVMLVLLVIFMVTTPLLSQGVKVDLPKEKAAAIEQKDHEPIVVSINAQGLFFVNIAARPDQALDIPKIQDLVRQTLAKDGATSANLRPVLIKADAGINYGAVVKMMAALQQAGVASVGLVTDDSVTPKPLVVENSVAKSGNAWR
jgi:biopolymer transport protein TolR